MNTQKYKITLEQNENAQYDKIITVIGKPIKYTTASQIFNSLTGYHSTPHRFKSNDTFSITSNNIRLVSFYGNKLDLILYSDGTVIDEELYGHFERLPPENNPSFITSKPSSPPSNYDYGLKTISHHTGLTGVESKNLARKLQAKNLDYQSYDWKTIGEDSKDYGSRTSSVENKLKSMYGVSLNEDKFNQSEFTELETDHAISNLRAIHETRTFKSQQMDGNLNAKQCFNPLDKEGVKKWKKHPNTSDIENVDDIQ